MRINIGLPFTVALYVQFNFPSSSVNYKNSLLNLSIATISRLKLQRNYFFECYYQISTLKRSNYGNFNSTYCSIISNVSANLLTIEFEFCYKIFIISNWWVFLFVFAVCNFSYQWYRFEKSVGAFSSYQRSPGKPLLSLTDSLFWICYSVFYIWVSFIFSFYVIIYAIVTFFILNFLV